MQYVISCLEGIITFVSPCLLPMLPIYISYFAGGGERTTARTVKNALGFVLGFTLVFVAMGALAGTVGSFFKQHQTAVNLLSGLVVILFGLQFLGVFKWNLFRGSGKAVNGEMGFFFRSRVRGDLLSGVDALCGGISGFCSGAGLPARARGERYADAAGLLPGAGDSLFGQCSAD